MSKCIHIKEERIKSVLDKGVMAANVFLDNSGDKDIACYIDRVKHGAQNIVIGYMSGDWNSSPTPEIIEWFAQNMDFYFVIRVGPRDDNDWLFSIVKITEEEANEISHQLMNKIYGDINGKSNG